jgi:hypothetical protein
MAISLAQIAEAVVRRAQRQGFVVARDVRAELQVAGASEQDWKAVLALARPALLARQGRYYHKEAFSPRLEQERAQQLTIQKTIRALIKEHRARQRHDERRGQTRVDFIQPVKVQGEDGTEHQLVSRDLSLTGVRLLGSRRLLGQKVTLLLPRGEGQPPCRLLVRILWTCVVGDALYENGGAFLQLVDAEADSDRESDNRTFQRADS